MSDQIKLPCPFCGESAFTAVQKRHTVVDPYFYVWCDNCDTTGPNKASEEFAVEAWNARKSKESHEAMRKALEKCVAHMQDLEHSMEWERGNGHSREVMEANGEWSIEVDEARALIASLANKDGKK